MDKQVATLLGVLGLSIVILYVVRPKNSNINNLTKKPKLDPPRTITKEAHDQKKDGSIAIDAMREALNNNEPQERIDELQNELKKDMNLKVLFDGDKLKATTLDGKLIVKEK